MVAKVRSSDLLAILAKFLDPGYKLCHPHPKTRGVRRTCKDAESVLVHRTLNHHSPANRHHAAIAVAIDVLAADTRSPRRAGAKRGRTWWQDQQGNAGRSLHKPMGVKHLNAFELRLR